MTQNTAKEFYAGKNDKGSGLSLMFVLEDNKEIRIKVSRDVAIGMIEAIYLALDNKGLLKNPREIH
jgi:hypothetical protein